MQTKTNNATPTVIVDPNGSWVGSHTPGDLLTLTLDTDAHTVTLGASRPPHDELPEDVLRLETQNLELRAEDADSLREWVELLIEWEPELWSDRERLRHFERHSAGSVMQELHDDFDIARTWVVHDWLSPTTYDALIWSCDAIPATWEADGWSTQDLVEPLVIDHMDRISEINVRLAGGEAALREYLTERIETRPV